MGVVYHAIDPNIGRPVAIKTIQLSGVRTPEEQDRLRERLFREARSAGILSHPGIVTIYDVEQQGDLAYIAMEYVDGPTLDQVLSGVPMPPDQMFSILGQTAVALDYAHGKGIVHRDIKPANIMIAADGTTKITDFGIAKVTTSEQFTMTGAIVGTPHYMSPEQVQGQPVDGRSDQFSLAVITYEMLTGEKPYTGEHLTTVVFKIVAEEPVAPMRLNPSLSGAIETVLKRGLAKKAEARYRTCQEYVDALEKACAASKGWKVMPRGGTLNEPTVADVPKTPITLPPARRRLDSTATMERGEKRKAGFLTFLLAILVAGGLLYLIGSQAAPWLLQQNQKQTQTAATPPQPKQIEPAPAQQQPPPGTTSKPPETPSGTQADAKPSPMPPRANPVAAAAPSGPVETKPEDTAAKGEAKALEEAARKAVAKGDLPARRTVSRGTSPQPVTIISSPGGASAMLDGRADTACTTPCSIDATPGRHMVAISLAGYGIEQREIDVGSSPMEVPAIVLHAPTGTLMLTSVPPGADVEVDGKRINQTTPAQIPLPPGSHKITVQKNGVETTQSVDIRTGISYLRISLGQ